MKYKTVEEMCADSEKAVYHFFPASRKDDILRDGLLCAKDSCSKSGEKKGIYVVWRDNTHVQAAIAEAQASVDKYGNPVGDMCRRYIELLEKQKIHYIYGYASSIYLLAKYALDNKIDMSHMRGAFTTSENLTDVYRETIEKAFGCRVMDCYGARDAGITAYEVTPGNYHLGYSALVEIVDEIAPNTGTLLSTNLLSMAFPVLRYDYGDVAELDNNCSAYNGQVLHKIYGRVSDVLRLDNGHVLTSPGFTILMRNFEVKAYDIQKLSGSHVRMQVQVAEGWDKTQEAKLIVEMQRFVGEGCEFTLEYVDGFQELKNGKRRYFMNDLS